MGKVIIDMAMSLDGFISSQKGEYIYPFKDIKKTKEFGQLQKRAGAVIMDLDAYNMAKGDFTNYEYQVPVFVITDKLPAKVAKGQNDKLYFEFVTSGVTVAIKKAKSAAGDKNVMIIGLEEAAQKFLKAGKVDEIIIRLIPVTLGKGIKLFEKLGRKEVRLKIVKSKQLLTRNDIYFKVLK